MLIRHIARTLVCATERIRRDHRRVRRLGKTLAYCQQHQRNLRSPAYPRGAGSGARTRVRAGEVHGRTSNGRKKSVAWLALPTAPGDRILGERWSKLVANAMATGSLLHRPDRGRSAKRAIAARSGSAAKHPRRQAHAITRGHLHCRRDIAQAARRRDGDARCDEHASRTTRNLVRTAPSIARTCRRATEIESSTASVPRRNGCCTTQSCDGHRQRVKGELARIQAHRRAAVRTETHWKPHLARRAEVRRRGFSSPTTKEYVIFRVPKGMLYSRSKVRTLLTKRGRRLDIWRIICG